MAKQSKWVVQAEVAINASPSAVYKAVTNVVNYPQWNPWIIDAEGIMKANHTVRLTTKLGDHVAGYAYRVMIDEPEELLVWQSSKLLGNLSGQQHRRYFAYHSRQTHYRAEVVFTGLFASASYTMLKKSMLEGMTQEMQALKQYVEDGECNQTILW